MMLCRPSFLRRTSLVHASRCLASASQETKFDSDMAKVYNQISSNHRHPYGPWKKMRDVVLAHAPPGASLTILDVASGPGEPAATIATALPSARVIATDVSEDMVAAATETHKNLSNLTAQVADAQDLSAFDDSSVDVVTCCYGYMFPVDKPKALKETYRVLKPGGLLVATTWDRTDILKISRDVMEAVLGAPPPTPPVNPMSLSEPGLFQKLVMDAGFTDVEQGTSTYPFDFGTEKGFQLKVGTILLKEKIDSFGEEGWRKAEEALELCSGV
eukprot:TRINITY_DN30957_c0_g1_i2.p1 TRINITY_DN30957_c0_g1~~TRINITY_DN30957_c0_g1_i2.p1  ORF type:complete len:273 (+),score=44.60 TRINITY_DN30957_c0_g1_i2:48-866(+)